MIKTRFEGSFSGFKKTKKVSPQTEFGIDDVTRRAAICFPPHRSLFTMYFIGSFEYRSISTAFLGRGFVHILGQIVSIRVITLINTNVVVSRLIKREKGLAPGCYPLLI